MEMAQDSRHGPAHGAPGAGGEVADGAAAGVIPAETRPPLISVPAPFVSIVVPVLDEAAVVPALVDGLAALETPPGFEVVLVDGGSRDGTAGRFRAAAGTLLERGIGARVFEGVPRGRASQLNAGARAARGAVLLFLHADTVLPPGAPAAVAAALADPRVVGGGFRHRFSRRGVLLRLISLYATARSLLRGVHYGDQAMFVRRSVFETLGGFPDIPLFEDLELSRALRARGRVATLPLAARTSARRLEQRGLVRTAVRFGWIKARYALGAAPRDLAAEYGDVREDVPP
jgi:rSAM/selenodomain-associated transferase 2